MHIDADIELVRQCRNGDGHAFELLIGKYEKPIYNAAFRMLRDTSDAEDVTQTAFMKAFEKLDSYKPEFRFYSWLYRIVINESINVLNGRHHSAELDEERIPGRDTPETSLDQGQLNTAMQSALMTISADYRAVVVLRHFLECSYHEISEALDIPEKTVKSRLFTARRLLRDRLANAGLL